MNTTTKRKELQAKLNHFISEFVNTLAHVDSKRLKKSIKKASKIISKAVLKKMDQSELETSLQDKKPVKQTPLANQKRPVRKRTSPSIKSSKPNITGKTTLTPTNKPVEKITASPKAPVEVKS